MTRVLHAAPWVLPSPEAPLRDGGVLVADGRVVAVGPAAELEAGADDLRRWPGVLAPGLVNAHAHLEYGPSFADLADGQRPFPEWIAELTRRRRRLDSAGWLEQARGSVAALLAAGTTCVGDVVTHGAGLTAAAEAGLAGVSYAEAVGVDDDGWPRERERVRAILDAAPPGRAVGVSPHTLYTLSGPAFRAALALARDRGLRAHTHLAETPEEHEFVLAGRGRFAEALPRLGLTHELAGLGSGRSPAHQLDRLGGLGPDVHVAHGVHLDAADRALLRARGSAVALCPRSNRTLRTGDAPVAALLAEGAPLAVGTDSLSSAPSLDLLADVRALRELAREQGYTGADLDRRLLAAATAGGARALGLPDVGRLGPGARADLAVWDVPVDADPVAALVEHGAGRCVGTVLAGRVVHERMPA